MKRKIDKLVEENLLPNNDVFDDNDGLEDNLLLKNSVNDLLNDEIEEFPGNNSLSFKSSIFPSNDIFKSDTKNKFTKSGKDFFDSPSEHDSHDESDNEIDTNKQNKKSISNSRKRKKSARVESDEESEDEISDESDEESQDEINNESDDENMDSDEAPKEASSRQKQIKRVKFQLSESQEKSMSENEDESSTEGDEESDGDEDESEIDDDLESDNEDENTVEHDLSGVFSKSIRDDSLELEKATAVSKQLALWDSLIESRILIQKSLVEINSVTQEQILESSFENKDSVQCLENYLKRLIDLQVKLRRETTKQENITEEEYEKFRNSSIENWYNKTKRARFNFSAFEAPLMKQMETDKQDLINKTYIKRSIEVENQGEDSKANLDSQIDKDTVNDDDFYHKLLRCYIKRKTADISDSNQLGRQWLKLQSLRSQAKRKIDTRKTKGRKLKFDVHNKLVNFMAPQKSFTWEDNAVNELYNSVFGKNLINN